MDDRYSKSVHEIEIHDSKAIVAIEKFNKVIKKSVSTVDRLANALKKEDNQQKKGSKTLELVSTKYNVTTKQIEALIKAKKQEELAWAKANFKITRFKDSTGKLRSQVTKLTMSQKLSMGMWSSSFPTLDKANKIFNSLRWSMVNVGFAIAGIAAIGYPFYALIKQGMEWEQQLKRIQVITGEAFDTNKLTSFLKETRQGTPFSTKEVSDSFLEFMKSGFNLSQTETAMKDITDLAVAGFTDLATATNIVSASMHQFALQGITTKEVVSVIAKAANKSAADVSTFGKSMSYVGPIAAQLGFSFKETAAAMTLLFNAGLDGSRAGTTMRQVLNSLSGPSTQASKWFDALGISIFNADGSMKTLNQTLLSVKYGLDKLNPEQEAKAMADMFSIRSRAGAAAFKNALDDSVSSMSDVEQSLNDINYASDAAATAYDTSINKLKGSINNLKDALLPLGTQMAKAFSPIVDTLESLTKALDMVNDKLGSVGTTAVSIGTVGAVGAAGYGLKKWFARGTPANPMYVVDISTAKGAAKAAEKTAGAYALKSGIKGFITNPGVLVLAAIAVADKLATRGRVGVSNPTYNEHTAGSFSFKDVGKGIVDWFKYSVLGNYPKPYGLTSVGTGGSSSKETVVPDNTNEKINTAQTALDKLFSTYNDKVKSITPIYDALFGESFTGTDDTLSIIQKYSDNIKVLFPADANKKILDFGIGLRTVLNNIKSSETEVYNAKKANDDLSVTISQESFDLKELNVVLKNYKDRLSDANDEISKLSGQRFTGETAFSRLIQAQEQKGREEKLAAMGINDVQSFIQSALNGTADSYDSVATSIDNVTSAADNSKNAFEAWQKTVQEHIKTLIKESNNLATDTTQAVQQHMTLLLSSSALSSSASGSSSQTTYLDKLKLAQEAYYGNMHEQVGFAIQDEEDRKNGVAANADVIISSLQNEWEKRDLIESQLERVQKQYDSQSESLKALQRQHDLNALAIQRETLQLKKYQDAYNIYVGSGGAKGLNVNGQIAGGTSSGSRRSYNGVSQGNIESFAAPGEQVVTSGGHVVSWRPGGTQPSFNDFVMRPGQSPVNFSKNDTLIGMKDLSGLGTNVNIGSINVNGNTNDVNGLARQLAIEIKRELGSGR